MKIFNIYFNKQDLNRVLIIIAASFFYSIIMNSFVVNANVFPAGYVGISRLVYLSVEQYTNYSVNFSIIYFILNVVTVIFVFNTLGKKLAIFSVIWFTCTSIFTYFLPEIMLTQDIMLNTVFGGVLAGYFIGLALKNNASSGGMDFIAIYMSNKYKKSMFTQIMFVNFIIVFVAGLLFGWERALYSMVYQFTQTQIINTMYDRYELYSLFMVTKKTEEVSKAFYKACRHGLTKVDAEGERSKEKYDMLFTTINSYQVNEVIDAIKKADPHIFISISKTEKVIGNYYQKPLD